MSGELHPAAFYFDQGYGILGWIVIGLIAGAVAGRVVRGRGYGCVVDVFVGLAGAVIGGALVGGFYHGSVGFLGSLLVAFIGSVVLLAVLRLIARTV